MNPETETTEDPTNPATTPVTEEKPLETPEVPAEPPMTEVMPTPEEPPLAG